MKVYDVDAIRIRLLGLTVLQCGDLSRFYRRWESVIYIPLPLEFGQKRKVEMRQLGELCPTSQRDISIWYFMEMFFGALNKKK